jgi:nuclear pore complex protein Nup205
MFELVHMFKHALSQDSLIFMILLPFQASNQEGAAKVVESLQGKMFRSVGWSSLFDSLSIYDEKFKQSFEIAGAMLLEFPEEDAKVIVSYLNVC